MNGVKAVNGFDRACSLLPEKQRAEALFLAQEAREQAEAIRLRAGAGAAVCGPDWERKLKGWIGRAEVEETLLRAARSSLYAAEESLREGWFTAEGGLRLGVAGSLQLREGRITGFRAVSSLCIRIPRAVPCVEDELFRQLWDRSVLIYSRPGAGKTTFLRDLIRRLSDGGLQVGLADERGEVAALSGGVPQLNVGCRTDVLEGAPKAQAAEMLLRTMGLQVIAVDELSAREGPALRAAASGGVRLVATAHGWDAQELQRRGLPLELFDLLLRIDLSGDRLVYTLEELPC